jgi:uncharacterized protein YidB (DUF937 family)
LLGGGGGGGQSALIGALAPALIGLLSGGGLSKILQGFEAKGFSSQADSWVSTGENQPISGADVKTVLDQGQIAEVAQQAGITEDQAADVLAEAIPVAVDRATPDGTVPDDAAVDAELQGRASA